MSVGVQALMGSLPLTFTHAQPPLEEHTCSSLDWKLLLNLSRPFIIPLTRSSSSRISVTMTQPFSMNSLPSVSQVKSLPYRKDQSPFLTSLFCELQRHFARRYC